MGFQFRYESLLSLRRHHKERTEIEYGEALGNLAHAEKTLREMEQECGRIENAFNMVMKQAAASHEVRNYAEYRESLKLRNRKMEKEIRNLKRAAAEKKKELLEKTKKFKVIETLRDKDFEKWKKHENDLEQKRLNELAVLRHERRYL